MPSVVKRLREAIDHGMLGYRVRILGEASRPFGAGSARPIIPLSFARCRYPGIKTFLASLVARYAQFARLRGAKLTVIPPQCPGSGEVVRLRGGQLVAGRICGGGPGARLDIY
jgi:hypothetical protein